MGRPALLVTTVIPGFDPAMLPRNFDCRTTEVGVLNNDELLSRTEGNDAVACTLVSKISAEFLQRFPRLKMVANIAVGYDNIDVTAATKYGVIVSNTPGVLDSATADLAFTLLLSIARRIPEAERYLRAGQWKSFGLDLLTGAGVFGKTIGLVGFGRIGQAMAARSLGFSMRVLYSQRNRASLETERKYGATYVSLEELLRNSDFVSVHCPLTAETRYLFNDDRLSMMKEGAFLINTARGAVVEESALIRALQTGKIAGAALDVFENEPAVSPHLLTLPNVVLVPHIGSATTETRKAMALLALSSIDKAFSGVQPENLVNPEVWTIFLKKLAADGLVRT